MSILCAIPARAGSKRLPNKNIRLLNGKPMIAYSIEAAQASGLFDAVYVCTDSEEIANIARDYGAEVPLIMSPELCGDLVPSHAPCIHLAGYLQDNGQNISDVMILQPSSPLRSREDIQASVAQFDDNHADFVVSATFIDPHYFHWALQPPTEDVDDWQMFFGSKYLIERPLLPPVFRPNGSIKIAKLEALQTTGHFFGENLHIVKTPEERSIHVATQFDFDLCEYLLSKEI